MMIVVNVHLVVGTGMDAAHDENYSGNSTSTS